MFERQYEIEIHKAIAARASGSRSNSSRPADASEGSRGSGVLDKGRVNGADP